MIRRVKGFGVVNKTEVDVFLELSCFCYDPVDVGNLISDSSAFYKPSLYIWNFLVHLLPTLELAFLLTNSLAAWSYAHGICHLITHIILTLDTYLDTCCSLLIGFSVSGLYCH